MDNADTLTIEKLKEQIKGSNAQADLDAIDRAYKFASEAHGQQKRLSGEPYIIHPLAVAEILAEMEMDNDTIIAALLHDVVEDTGYTTEDVASRFGKPVAELVDGVTKLGKIPYSSKEEQQVENLRKMFMAMAKDIRVILIKLADRLHNMRTMKYQPVEKQRQKSLETMEIYAPLAHRLGISKIKWELEDLSLRYLDSVAYHDLVSKISHKRAERDEYVEEIKKTLSAKINESGLNFYIEGRVKHFYSIYKKMYSQNKTLDEIYDLFAVRVIVDTVADCYNVLGIVHDLYKPMPGRFKDYIAMPKPNMYQSLHTTVIGKSGQPFEIQIRTWEMHRTSEYGVAAHWKYKEGKSAITDFDEKMSWIRQLMEIQRDMVDAEDFMQSLKIDLFSDEVFVFTPKGDVINLPSGSTPIDFAFAIHSAVGCKMLGAKVNGKIVPLEYKLENGDICDIITSSGSTGPSRDWLKIVKTSQARNKINQWFKKQNRDENVQRGKEALDKEIKKADLAPEKALSHELIDGLLKKYSFKSLDDLYASIGYDGITLSRVIAKIKDQYHKHFSDTSREVDIDSVLTHSNKNTPSNGVIVKDIDNCLVRFARCCNPIPGDDIIGYITRGRGVSVHRTDCPNILAAKSNTTEFARLIDAYWANDDANKKDRYIAGIIYTAYDNSSILSSIAGILSEYNLSTRTFNARVTSNGMAVVELEIEIANKQQLDNLITKLKTIKDTVDVKRASTKKI